MADAPAAAAAEHLQPLGSKGQSVSWKRYKANALERRMADAADDAAGAASPPDEAPVAAQRREVSGPDEGRLARPVHVRAPGHVYLHGAQEGQRRLPDGDHGKKLPELRAPVRV